MFGMGECVDRDVRLVVTQTVTSGAACRAVTVTGFTIFTGGLYFKGVGVRHFGDKCIGDIIFGMQYTLLISLSQRYWTTLGSIPVQVC